MGDSAIVASLFANQRRFFGSTETLSLEFRKKQLERLKEAISKHENQILQALKVDLCKPTFEAYASEVGFLYGEIRYALKNLDAWMLPQRVSTPWLHFLGRSHIYSEPLGTVLILGPWNYPVQLLLSPLVAAISAGNTAVLKPSELAPRSAEVIAAMIEKTFDPSYIAVALGGPEVSQALVAEKCDHIFFTGSSSIGRSVMSAAAKNLTPVTLELGGKSPCIVDTTAPLAKVARRIVWGKFFNAGQTCVAPDYLLVPTSIKTALLSRMKEEVDQFFGADPFVSPDFARIVNDRHFERLLSLLSGGHIIHGGKFDRENRYLSPTLMDEVDLSHPLMEEEIFGPILPVIEYGDLEEAFQFVRQRPKPLALYFFSNNSDHQKKVIRNLSFGGGCFNDTLVHLTNPRLPFGGVGQSGFGRYHGKFGFDTFSHKKSLVHRSFLFELKLRYPPYRERFWLLKKILTP